MSLNLSGLAIVNVDIEKPIKPEVLPGVLTLYDRAANTFRTTLNRDGVPLGLVGCTATGFFTNANGETKTIKGSVDGSGVITVGLTPECYLVPGRFTMTIKVTSESQMKTVRIIRGYMEQTIQTDMWKDIDHLNVVQNGQTVLITVVPRVDTGFYVVYETVNGIDQPVGHIRENDNLTLTVGASEGEHLYKVVPMWGNEAGNMSEEYGVYVM